MATTTPISTTSNSATGASTNDAADESTTNATWSRMLEGNERFAAGQSIHPHQDMQTRAALVNGQHPDAAVLSCSDSREIPEMIFDQGFGDMFTVRSAGQMLDDAVIASLEYAVEHLGVSLIVVLGHQHCGAVASAVEALDTIGSTLEGSDDAKEEELDRLIPQSDSIIVRSVGASVQQAREAELDSSDDFERVHVARTIEELVDRSETVRAALAAGKLTLVGARYLLDTGKVEVLSF